MLTSLKSNNINCIKVPKQNEQLLCLSTRQLHDGIPLLIPQLQLLWTDKSTIIQLNSAVGNSNRTDSPNNLSG